MYFLSADIAGLQYQLSPAVAATVAIASCLIGFSFPRVPFQTHSPFIWVHLRGQVLRRLLDFSGNMQVAGAEVQGYNERTGRMNLWLRGNRTVGTLWPCCWGYCKLYPSTCTLPIYSRLQIYDIILLLVLVLRLLSWKLSTFLSIKPLEHPPPPLPSSILL